MTKNDTFFKILFAILLALIPLVFFAFVAIDKELSWIVGLFILALVVVRIWLDVFKNKNVLSHKIISTLAEVIALVIFTIFFMAIGKINVVLGIFVIIFMLLMDFLLIYMDKFALGELANMIDICYKAFTYLALVGMGLSFLISYNMVALIGVIAMLITSVISVVYKLYYLFRYTDKFKFLKRKRK